MIRARNATAAVFMANGFLMASWVSRIPAARSSLHLSPGQLGLLLLCPAIGSALALPAAGHVVLRLGAQGAIRVFAVVCAGGTVLAGAGVSAHLALLAALGLFFFGLGTSLWDVAMNVEGAAVEQALTRSIMPRFHAGWSLGSVAGALVGAGFAALDPPLVVHLAITSASPWSRAETASQWFLVGRPAHRCRAGAAPGRPAGLDRAAHPADRPGHAERALVEGVANDWFGLSLVDGYHQRQVVRRARLRRLRDDDDDRPHRRHQPDRPLRPGDHAADVGPDRGDRASSWSSSAPGSPIALLGGVLWGAGAALGFPMGMSAAADDPVWAAPRLGVVTSIGYLAFLAGPPLVGFVADGVGVRRAVGVVLVALVVIAVLAPVERPLESTGGTSGAPSGNGDSGLTS